MKEFFADEITNLPFILFGKTHLFCIAIMLLGVIIIYINRNKISKLNEKTTRKILKISAGIMLINMILFNAMFLYYGVFDYKIHLPFHLCFISGYLFMYGIFFKKDNLLKITYFLSILGPLPAIIWPEFRSTWDSFEFYEYFISHHFFLLISYFGYFALNLKITFKDAIKTLIIGNAILFLLMPFNKIYETNYIFSSEIPDVVKNTLPFLKYIHPIIILEFLGLSVAVILYYCAKKRNKSIEDT